MVERRGRVALITGAGRGIGSAAAGELARRGYGLVLASRTTDELETTAATLRESADMLVVPADVTDVEQVNRLVEKAIARFSRIDALVHCAGLAPAIPVEQMTTEQWHEVIDTNLSSAFYLARALWPIFRRQQAGVLVNISSYACRDPFPGFGAYGAAKAGLNILSLMLAREGAQMNVRVYAIAPGAVETGMFRKLMTEEQWPTSKTLAPADVAHFIGQCVEGELPLASGEVIFLNKLP